MKKRYNIKTTPLQKRAVDNIISGKFPSKKAAMKAAGYAERSAAIPTPALIQRKGVKIYLKKLSKIAKERWNMDLPDKVALTYLDGLMATKLVGSEAIEHPDYAVRKTFADAFAEFFGWRGDSSVAGNKYAQYNFFSIGPEKRRGFNERFKNFLAEHYSK
jgi:hypothetical protein